MRCPQDDILIYATAFYRRFGGAAYYMACDRARDLTRIGDAEGGTIWSRVASAVSGLAGDQPLHAAPAVEDAPALENAPAQRVHA